MESKENWTAMITDFLPIFINMMNRLKPDVDVIKDILNAVLAAQPESSFVQSLLVQYQERGGLSKKQLQGLYDKASRIRDIPVNKLATLEAVILKKPTKYRSSLPPSEPLFAKDSATGQLIEAILAKYPQHKRVLFLKSKYDNNDPISPSEMSELEKFSKL
jgi:hypothetical protein